MNAKFIFPQYKLYYLKVVSCILDDHYIQYCLEKNNMCFLWTTA